MPTEYSARQPLLWQLIAKKNIRNDSYCSEFQAFIFSVHETGKTYFHHAVRCQLWLSIARHSQSRNCLCIKRILVKEENLFGGWKSMYFCDICPVHDI